MVRDAITADNGGPHGHRVDYAASAVGEGPQEQASRLMPEAKRRSRWLRSRSPRVTPYRTGLSANKPPQRRHLGRALLEQGIVTVRCLRMRWLGIEPFHHLQPSRRDGGQQIVTRP